MLLNARRNQQGGVMGLIIVCSLVLALVVFAYFQLSMMFGGSHENRNAVDAGTLNVGKQAMTLKTSTAGGAESQFDDVRDTTGKIGLLNINRVWGKALLINANAQAMGGAGSASSHANEVFNAAQAISDRITSQIKDKSVTEKFFEAITKANSVRMLGLGAEIQSAPGSWDTSCVDRSEESNLRLIASQLPDGVSVPQVKAITEKGGGGPTNFIQGYNPIPINGKHFTFVPFKYDEKPHLIAGKYFKDNMKETKAVPQWSNPVPNAISAHGRSANQTYNATDAVAYVVTNPQRQYNIAIPHAFIRIKLEKNKAKWNVNGIPITESEYGYMPDYQTKIIAFDVGTGTITGHCMLGNEFLPPTLRQAIHALSTHSEVNKALLQRCREIKPDFSSGDLESLLSSTALIPGVDEYFIYPRYTTADKTDPKLACNPKAIAMAESGAWMKPSSEPDGSESKIATESRPMFTAPNIATQELVGTGCKPGPFFTTMDGELWWKPGTGYDQCLGTLRMQRTTNVYVNGVCTLL